MALRRRAPGSFEHGEGKTLRGEDPRRRCGPFWDLGRGVGLACSKCGRPKRRADQDETPCPGVGHHSPQALLRKRETAIPNLLLAWAWARCRRQLGDEIDPNTLLVNKAATRRALLGLDRPTFECELARLGQESKRIYQAVGADTDPREHLTACALAILMLSESGLLPDPGDQAVLTSMALMEEAKDHGSDLPYRPAEAQRLAERMIKKAAELGYYGGKLRSFGGPAR